MSEEYIGWHFLRKDRRLGYGDGREVVVGETLTVTGPLELCKVGLHASTRAIDALQYAPGPIACRVRLSGDVLAPEGDKACASERTVIAMGDATDALRLFVIDTLVLRQSHVVSLLTKAGLRDHAVAVAALIITSEPLSTALEVFTAAWDAARAAARDAALDAARAAALDAAWDAALAAAWDAARAAAWDAAWDAARAAARAAALDAAWDAALAAALDAARAAALDAALDAARAALNDRLEARLMVAVGHAS